MALKSMPDNIALCDRYPVSCPVCGDHNLVKPSIFMEMGVNRGSITCPKCKNWLVVEIAPNGLRMDARLRTSAEDQLEDDA